MVALHKDKVFKTLDVLMSNLNMAYYWQRIKIFFSDRDPDLEELAKLFNRCIKLYTCINELMNTFKLMQKFHVSIIYFLFV